MYSRSNTNKNLCEGFGLTFAEAMDVDYMVIAARHPDSAADEVIGDAGFLVDPTVGDLASVLEGVFDSERPRVDPRTRAKKFDWDRVAEDALKAYRAAANDEW